MHASQKTRKKQQIVLKMKIQTLGQKQKTTRNTQRFGYKLEEDELSILAKVHKRQQCS